MKKILLLGSGELGKEFVISAKRLGCYVIACDNYAGAPAMQVADECEIFSMLDEAPLRAAIAKHKPDLIVPEIEAIRTEVLLDVEKEGFEVIPSARAANLTMNRDRIRDVAVGLGVRTAKFNYADSSDELMAQAKAHRLTGSHQARHEFLRQRPKRGQERSRYSSQLGLRLRRYARRPQKGDCRRVHSTLNLKLPC